MDNLNYVFFEEFKGLDKLCGELYGDQHGISKYIDDMKAVPGNDCRNIPDWKADLGCLVRIRHIRNYLAHTEGAFQEEACTQKDIDWCRDFHGRILKQSDPLAMLYQHSKTERQAVKTKRQGLQHQAMGRPVQAEMAKGDTGETGTDKDTGMKTIYWAALFMAAAAALLLAVYGMVQPFV